MTGHMETVTGKTFKIKSGTYNLSHSYGHWRLVKVIDGKLHDKSEFSSKNDEAVFKYISDAERCTPMEARLAYNNAPIVQ